MSETQQSKRRNRPWLWVFLGLALVGIGLVIFNRTPPEAPGADLEAAAAANARGVGYMEQFDYAQAEKEFDRAVKLAPDWLSARINLGIALFNQQPSEQKALSENVARAQGLFRDILDRESDNKQAHYCLGMIALYAGRPEEAYPHFAAVGRLDPADAHTQLRLGVTHPEGPTSPEAIAHFESALKQNPYLNEARYRLATALTDAERRDALFAEHEALQNADRFAESRIVYAEMGRYADVIGRVTTSSAITGPLPVFEPVSGLTVNLAPNVRWATQEDLDAVTRAVRDRFGGALVLADFTGDGRIEVFCASAVVNNGDVRNLILRQDGPETLTDVTDTMGLTNSAPALGAAAGDFDNDGFTDLVLATTRGLQLFRNTGTGEFVDVTAEAKLDANREFLRCAFADMDQDGDLDIIAVSRLDHPSASSKDGPPGRVVFFENIGEAPPVPLNAPPLPLTPAFQVGEVFQQAVSGQAATGMVVTDFDSDGDVDLVLLPESGAPVGVRNERLMRFTRIEPAWAAELKHNWLGGLVLDADHDERSDLFLIRDQAPPVYLVSTGTDGFTPGVTNSPPLRQALTVDLDLDGWPDIVGLNAAGEPVVLQNREGKLEHVTNALGTVQPAHAVAAADLTGNGAFDVLLWTDAGLTQLRGRANGNSGVAISPTGRRDTGTNLRTPADGTGTQLMVQAGTHWSGAERTTVASGLGQSLLPTTLGLGRRDRADVLRVRWPDAVIQAELDVPAGPYKLIETNRKGTSCPVLMAWNGERFSFITDFLGGGALGECGPNGDVRPPRPVESVKIESSQLVPRDGVFTLKIAEPMDEVLYLDFLQLDVVDHPADAEVFPDERFVFAGPEPTQDLLAFSERVYPVRATDETGADVMDAIRARDRLAVDRFPVRSWLGYAANHALILDFPEVSVDQPWVLVLAGWTEYPYPESMYAATRAGVPLQPPVLEREVENGIWVKVCDVGFPAGLPRVMTCPLHSGFPGGRVRITTNMQVYWDHVYLGESEPAENVGRITARPVSRATLAARGFMREILPNGRPPVAYDDAHTEPVAVTRWRGKLTRLGDVAELIQTADDRLVVCGPGDEITVEFDASNLPTLPENWVRSFVLRSRGYCKDTSTTTVTGGQVEPMPFRAMPNYPDFGATPPPETDAASWHTRPAGGRR